MKLFIPVVYGNEIPRWYGVAWRDPGRDASVTAPIPLNLLLNLARRFFLWLRFPAIGKTEIYEHGYNQGWEDAFAYGLYQRDS